MACRSDTEHTPYQRNTSNTTGSLHMQAVMLSLRPRLSRFAAQCLTVAALSVASFTYGGLLGAFFLAMLVPRAIQRDAIVGMTVGIGIDTRALFGEPVTILGLTLALRPAPPPVSRYQP